MPENVDGHGGDPQYEGGLVEKQELVPHVARTEQESDAGTQDGDGQYDEEWTQKPEQRRRRALPPVLGRAQIVASEPPRRASDLQDDRRNEHHADHYMESEELSDPQYGEPFHQQQNQKDYCRHTSQSGIGFHSVTGRVGRFGHWQLLGQWLGFLAGRRCLPPRQWRSWEVGAPARWVYPAAGAASHPSHGSALGTILRHQRTSVNNVTFELYQPILTIR
jgi:hypothetical protein